MDTAPPVRRDLIQALIFILSKGIQENDLDDAGKLLSAIRILDPSLVGLDEFASYIAIKRGHMREALQIYSASPVDTSKWYVMMALCLKLTGDPTWHWHASQSLEKDDSSSAYSHHLARILLGMPAAESDDTQAAADPAPANATTVDARYDYLNYLAV